MSVEELKALIAHLTALMKAPPRRMIAFTRAQYCPGLRVKISVCFSVFVCICAGLAACVCIWVAACVDIWVGV